MGLSGNRVPRLATEWEWVATGSGAAGALEAGGTVLTSMDDGFLESQIATGAWRALSCPALAAAILKLFISANDSDFTHAEVDALCAGAFGRFGSADVVELSKSLPTSVTGDRSEVARLKLAAAALGLARGSNTSS